MFYDSKFEKSYSKTTSLEHRRAFGQFFTPYEVALLMSDWILGVKSKSLSVLDPATGLGIFERAIEERKTKSTKINYDLWEIDPKIEEELQRITQHELSINSNINLGDFLLSPWNKKYDGIIANPPYYKHHKIKNKQEIHKVICNRTESKFSLNTNIYCWFLIKSISQLKKNGRLAFIVPSEFLNSNYGEAIKRYLLETGVVLHLINIDFKENVFDNALTTSVIILAEKKEKKTDTITFYNVKDYSDLEKNNLNSVLEKLPKRKFSIDELEPKIKWKNYFTENNLLEDISLVPFSTYGRFSRGIATGCNSYFTLSKKESMKFNLPDESLIKCIVRSNYVTDILFTEYDFKKLIKEEKKVYLFNGEVQENPYVQKYIQIGVDKGIDQKYLTKNRSPWYQLEKREVSRIWAGVFARKGIKLIWNESSCLNLTCFHAFYPTELGKKYEDILFLYLNTDFSKKLLELEKRQFGNGLSKFEPNDINKSKAFNLESLKKGEIANLKQLQKEFLSSKSEENRKQILKKANEYFNLNLELILK
jgi:adenine-specific DNA-methyltransferase